MTEEEKIAYTKCSWSAMIGRCKPNSRVYKYYMGSGITVCERWDTFENFLEDMGYRPDGLTLDRIDNDKGYQPGNCRWATMAEQCLNRRKRGTVLDKTPEPALTYAQRKKLTYGDLTTTISVWSSMTGIDEDEIVRRLKNEFTPAQALGFESRKLWIIDNGIAKRIRNAAKEYNISAATIKTRLSQGATAKQALGIEPYWRNKKRPDGSIRTIHFKDVTRTVAEWANIVRKSPGQIKRSMDDHGCDAGQALGFKPHLEADVDAFRSAVLATGAKLY